MAMVMDVGMMYALTAFVCVLCFAIILNRTLTTKYTETIDRSFVGVLVYFIVFSAIDCIWGVFFSDVIINSRIGYIIFSYGFHSAAAVSAFVWAQYMLNFVRISKIRMNVFKVILSILIACQAFILFSNIFIFPEKVFAIDSWEGNSYHTGPLRTVLFWLQYSYYVLVTINGGITLITNRDPENSQRCKAVFIFSMIPLVGGIAQLFFPDAPMYSISFMLVSVTIYSFNITSQRENYLAQKYESENAKLSSMVTGLSGDFEELYYVNLQTGDYEIVEKGILATKSEDTSAYHGKDFFKNGISKFMERVCDEDIATIGNYLSLEKIYSELENKPSFNFTCRLKTDIGIRYYMIKVIRSDLDLENNYIIIGVFDDDERIMEEMKEKEDLREAQQKAEAASQAKTNFLFNMSHDILTPMNAIIGFSEIARRNIEDKKIVSESLEKVESASSNLLSLINDILDMSRIENNKVTIENRPINIVELGTDMINIALPLAEQKNIQIEKHRVLLGDGYVMGDSVHISRVMINILTNAVKYTPNGGKIICSILEKENKQPTRSSFDVIIADNGIGMSEDYQQHIFETFSRERNTTLSGVQGTGLGMAISKSLMDLMGGTIHIDSSVGKGTTVTLSFDLEKAEVSKDLKEEKGEGALQSLEGKKLLLVEDNELNREIVYELLDELNLKITTAENGSIALEKCISLIGKPREEQYDFILMDIQMPVMDGYTAAKAIRALEDEWMKKVPIIAMTANVFAEDIEKSQEAGMNAHLGKPININEVELILKKVSKF